jgi:glutathione S-transferase
MSGLKLYFAPTTCSLSPHIALREAELDFQLCRVDLRAQRTVEGEDYRAINPKGYVPALRLPNGQLLTEGAVIVQYIADLRPASGLAPACGTLERYRLQEWLVYISTELHKQFSPLFSPALDEAQRIRASQRLIARLPLLETQLASSPFLLGDRFSVADGYAFAVLSWARKVKLSLADFPSLVAYLDRLAERPAVRAAVDAERASRLLDS